MTAQSQEQVRRLKNTIRGASYRLTQLAHSGEVGAPASDSLVEVARDLAAAAARLEQLLSALGADG